MTIWSAQILKSLQVLGKKGIINRVVTKDKVLLDSKGNAILADFTQGVRCLGQHGELSDYVNVSDSFKTTANSYEIPPGE